MTKTSPDIFGLSHVVNLATNERRQYTCSPREAVIAAYAQSKGDNNTWNYSERYDCMVQRYRLWYFLNDWACRHAEEDNQPTAEQIADHNASLWREWNSL